MKVEILKADGGGFIIEAESMENLGAGPSSMCIRLPAYRKNIEGVVNYIAALLEKEVRA